MQSPIYSIHIIGPKPHYKPLREHIGRARGYSGAEVVVRAFARSGRHQLPHAACPRPLGWCCLFSNV